MSLDPVVKLDSVQMTLRLNPVIATNLLEEIVEGSSPGATTTNKNTTAND